MVKGIGILVTNSKYTFPNDEKKGKKIYVNRLGMLKDFYKNDAWISSLLEEILSKEKITFC